MAIGTDALIDFFGTLDRVTGTPGTVANNAFSAASDVSVWTNDDDAVEIGAVLTMQYPSGTLDAAPHVILHYSRDNIDSAGTGDENDASTTNRRPLGTFPIQTDLAATTDQIVGIRVRLPNLTASQDYTFFIENQTGVTISATWELDITPISPGPHA